MADKKPKTNRRTMDVIPPGKSPASPTSRPVIIPHRSMMQADPMLAPEKDSSSGGEAPSGQPFEARDLLGTGANDAEAEKETADTQVETADTPAVPEAAADDTSDLPSAPRISPSAARKKIEPVFSVANQDETVASDDDSTADAGTGSDDAGEMPEKDAKDTGDAGTAKTGVSAASARSRTVTPRSALKDTGDESQDSGAPGGATEMQTGDSSTPAEKTEKPSSPSDDGELVKDSGDEVSSEKTAEQARLEQLEALAAEGTYRVRISDDDGRNTRWLLILLFCIIAAVIALDVLLDLGLLELPGVPHTNLLD